MMNQVRNQKGISIIEVLVAAGLTAVVSLGIATMIQNSMIEQKKTVLLATLRENKIRIENMLRDQQAWTYTLADSNNLAITPANQSTACLRDTTACAVIAGTAPQKLVVRDAANNEAFNLLNWAGTGSNGFTESGATCSTFTSSQTGNMGNDSCPISYRLVYMYTCPSGTTCVNPQVKIVGRLIYNPSNQGYLHRFRGLIDQGNLSRIDLEGPENDGRYDIVVKRTAVQTNRQFRLTMGFTPANSTPSCANAGAGACTAGWGYYPTGGDRGLWQNPSGDSSLYQLSSPATRFTFTANNGGPYSCIVNAQAFSTGSFGVQIYNVTNSTVIAEGTTTAGQWAMSNAIVEAKFIAVPGELYTIRQRCPSGPPSSTYGDTTVGQCSLGIAQSYSGRTDYVSLSCYKVDM
ncbi:PulJ/GspJ family protein [Pseudobdellovibrio exovorus]|uniref:Uncharacterized protein n=1 Tax=Pseudobdellovibrio exovorus JSS TaxID=1184267 RepID=M4VR14_9BACT|nr:prepilin-type N-terminal cleavage/methylation domain-containing protein [Pseudobdellovibrio exovorus]AGH95609.1 hypothetical protein A11Q_1393 [Pseudobdellovibrio exovorus JSS]